MRRVAALSLVIAACGPADAPPAGSGAPIDTLLSVDGTRLFVHAEGAGEPMVIVHGGPLLDHGYLVQPFRPLGDRYRLILYDQMLSGRSDGVVDSASVRLARFAEHIEALRDRLEVGRIHLVGHSWGGLIAMQYAGTHPDALRSLVLLNPMPPTADLWQEAQAALAAALEPADTAGLGAARTSEAVAAGDPEAIEALLKLTFRSQFHDPARADDLSFRVPADYLERSRQFGHIAVDLVDYDLMDGLARLDVPTLVVYGGAELGVEPGVDALRTTLPDVTVVAITDAGHFPFIERPVETRRVISEWLAKGAR